MRTAILGFTAGVALLQTQAALPAHSVAGLLAGLCCSLVSGSGAHRPACGSWSRRAQARGWVLPGPPCWRRNCARREGRNVTLTGTTASLPYRFDQGVRFICDVIRGRSACGGSASDGAAMVPRLSREPPEGRLSAVGERWQLTVHRKRPHGNANALLGDVQMCVDTPAVDATFFC